MGRINLPGVPLITGKVMIALNIVPGEPKVARSEVLLMERNSAGTFDIDAEGEVFPTATFY
jgi:hypothetical protein